MGSAGFRVPLHDSAILPHSSCAFLPKGFCSRGQSLFIVLFRAASVDDIATMNLCVLLRLQVFFPLILERQSNGMRGRYHQNLLFNLPTHDLVELHHVNSLVIVLLLSQL